ncbi:glycosyltransferase family 4 protein [candidate division KSB1 bacterium]|nr:glycosyltransferase family 4 protein [candidate division KSB1 bacterium]
MVRILLVGPHRSRQGGVANHIRALLTSQLREQYDLDYFRVGSSKQGGVLNVIITSLFTPIRYLLKVCFQRPAVVHLNPSFDYKSLMREFSLVLISRMFRLPIVTQLHGGDLERVKQHGTIPIYLRCLLKWSSRLIVLTKIQREPLLEYVDVHKIAVIPNMIDVTQFDRTRSERQDEFHLLFLSRMEAEKGILDIYEAIPLILEKYPNLRISFAGEGKDMGKLKLLCSKKPFCDAVNFRGYIRDDEKIDFLMSGDIFILPSHHKEGMPYSILEAMAAGLPIITTSCGAIPEIIDDGENGFLIPPGRPDLIADRVERLLSNLHLRSRISVNNKAKAKSQFDSRSVTRKFSEVYEHVRK